MSPLPPKQKARVADGALEYTASGTGGPTIVLVNGRGGPIEGWFRIFGGLERLSSVIAYNRFGVDGSDKPRRANTSRAVVAA